MKKIEIDYKYVEDGKGNKWPMLATRCPNGINCFVGSAACFECRHCDNKKDSRFGRYVLCKLDNRQLDLFDL